MAVLLECCPLRGYGLFQIARHEEEGREDDGGEVLQMERVCLMGQVAEHHHRHAEGFHPVDPVETQHSLYSD